MEYLGHTQSADYTFGPWRIPGFRMSPFLPPVNQQPQQQQQQQFGYQFPVGGQTGASATTAQVSVQQQQSPWQRGQPPATAVGQRMAPQPQRQQPSTLTNGQSQPYQYQRSFGSVAGGVDQPGGGCMTRSKTCIGLGSSSSSISGHQFDASFRPSAFDDLPSRDRIQQQNGSLTCRPSATSAGAAASALNCHGSFTSRCPPSNGLSGGGGGAPSAVDWASWTRAELTAADRARSGSELVRADVLTLCRDATDRTRRTQADTTRQLGDRVQDVKFWRDEVRKEIERADAEKQSLQKATSCLERALEETAEPLRIAEECMRLRQQKIDSNLVHDEVESELLKVCAD